MVVPVFGVAIGVPVLVVGLVPVVPLVPVAPGTPVPVRPPQSGGMVVLGFGGVVVLAVPGVEAPGAAPGFVSLLVVVVVVPLPDVLAPVPVVPVVEPAEGVQFVSGLVLRPRVWVVDPVCVETPVFGPLETCPVAPPLWTVAVPLAVPVVLVAGAVPLWAATHAADARNKPTQMTLFIILPSSRSD